jgi:EamA domain-containing membrane protein RarD
MNLFAAQSTVALVLGLAALAAEAWALVDALLNRPDAFVAAGKRTKTFWLVVTGVATAIGFVFFANPFNIFSLVAIAAAGVYLTDVRPALRAVGGRGRRTGSSGPYGPW